MADQNQEENSSKKGGKNKGRAAILICFIIVIVLLGVIIALLLKKNNEAAAPQQPAEETDLRGLVVNEDNVDQAVDAMVNGPGAPDNYEVTMNSTWNFPDGSQASDNAYVENSKSNSNDVYFDLELSDTGEVLLESPVIPVGSHMDRIKLDKELDKGTYDCILTYHLLDGNQNTVGTVKMVVTVVIEA